MSIKPQLYQLVLGSPSLGQILLYTPPAKDGEGNGMLLGKPVIFHEHAAVLGTPGDIILADLDQYMIIDKDGVRQDYSIHVNFLTDEGVFRFVYRRRRAAVVEETPDPEERRIDAVALHLARNPLLIARGRGAPPPPQNSERRSLT